MKRVILEQLPPGERKQNGDYTALGVWRKPSRGIALGKRMVRLRCVCGTVRDYDLSSWRLSVAGQPTPERCSKCAKALRGKWNGKSAASSVERKSRREWPMIRDAAHARELIAKGEWP